MLRSPDRAACYLRLTPEELALAYRMDGERTVARLVAEFARISERIAPEQVRRLVADLAGNRMLDELPVDAYHRITALRRRPWPVRFGQALLAAAQGRRMVVADVDGLVGALYRAGGRWLFTRPAVVLLSLVAVAGLAGFLWTWWAGAASLFLTGGSYAAGAAVLFGLNLVALACHEAGHALAAKHAGRRVPAAGFLVYFGIPSVFVDTTDVWMAGRRARLLTTAAGPATGLVLAGAASLAGLVFPAAAPWTFKLAFVWYLNALFNLNPLLALDGYYLLMDWLEVPNLRARGLAWIRARMRPRWHALDSEGRLIALYGILSVLWFVIAVNLAYRIYADRVAGLVLGVWHAGWAGRALLVAVVAGLAAPLGYVVAAWLGGRILAVRRWWERRRLAADAPRRLAALRSSALGHLSVEALAGLADRARWLDPRPGTVLAVAGAPLPEVFVVVDGAVEGRRPGDPGGTVRQRVGPGGVVGLGAAVAGNPAPLSFHTVGTTLLAVPAAAVATAYAGEVAPPDPTEIESAFSQTPGLAELTDEERHELALRARLTSIPPDEHVPLPGPDEALVVVAGMVVWPDGTELGHGSVILPSPGSQPGELGVTRTWTRLCVLPLVTVLGPPPAPAGGRPRSGVHPIEAYPPLQIPPGPPPPGLDDQADRRFERPLWWLVLVLLLLALVLTGTNLRPGPAWAEMPADQVLLSVERGLAAATIGGEQVEVAAGDRVYLAAGDRVRLDGQSSAELIFHGGAAAVLCPATDLTVATAQTGQSGRLAAPAAALTLTDGRLLADTASVSPAYAPLALQVRAGNREVRNEAEAWYAVDPDGVLHATGALTVDGVSSTPTETALNCGDGVPVEPPGGTETPTPTPAGTPTPTPSPSASPTPSPTPTPTAAPPPGPQPPAGQQPPAGPQPGPPPPGQQTSAPEAPPPQRTQPPAPPTSNPAPPNRPPNVTVQPRQPMIAQEYQGWACGDIPETTVIIDVIVDDPDGDDIVSLQGDYVVERSGMSGDLTRVGDRALRIGPIPWSQNHELEGSITITVRAVDSAGNQGSGTAQMTLGTCTPG